MTTCSSNHDTKLPKVYCKINMEYFKAHVYKCITFKEYLLSMAFKEKKMDSLD